MKKGTDEQYVAVLLLHNITNHYQLCNKFQNHNSSSCWEICDRKNVHMYYIRVKEGKMKNWKKKAKLGVTEWNNEKSQDEL